MIGHDAAPSIIGPSTTANADASLISAEWMSCASARVISAVSLKTMSWGPLLLSHKENANGENSNRHFPAAGRHARAGETAAIQLSCAGAAESSSRLFTLREVLIVNLTDQTVSGFGIVAHIERADDTSVTFEGEGGGGTIFLKGSLDRFTGKLSARRDSSPEPPLRGRTDTGIEWRMIPDNAESITYKMDCNVINRLF
jgi:hypothetical protein